MPILDDDTQIGENERFCVKFHFKSQQGIENLTNEEAEKLIGKDRVSHQKDLYESIENVNYPRWNFRVQIMPGKEAASYRFHPFDLTKVWSYKD